MTVEEQTEWLLASRVWAARFRNGMYYRMVAECIYSKFCTLGIKEGDKYVVYGALLNKQTRQPHSVFWPLHL